MRRVATVLAMALAGFAAAAPTAAGDGVTAIATPGEGTLTVCRSWIVQRSCRSYHKVVVPPRLAVGDHLTLTFGSNPKDYVFAVTAIRPKGATCLVLSDQSGGAEDGERLEISPCRPAAAAEEPAGPK